MTKAKRIYLVIALAGAFGAGLALGFSIANNDSVALKGCEVTAASVEEELEETRWKLSQCTIAGEEVLNRCKSIIENLMKDRMKEL